MHPKSLFALAVFATSGHAQLSGPEVVAGIDRLTKYITDINTALGAQYVKSGVSYSHRSSPSSQGQADTEPKATGTNYAGMRYQEESLVEKLADTGKLPEAEQAQACDSFQKVPFSLVILALGLPLSTLSFDLAHGKD